MSDGLNHIITRSLPLHMMQLLEATSRRGYKDVDVKQRVLIMLNVGEIELTADRVLVRASQGTANTRATIVQGLFDRYEIAKHDEPNMRWSGSRWVPASGDVQVCNLDTEELARTYAASYGLELMS